MKRILNTRDMTWVVIFFRIYFAFFLLLNLTKTKAQTVAASFVAPDTVCVNQTFSVQNTSSGSITSQYWSFCLGNPNTPPVATNLGNIGGLNTPVYYSIAKEGNNYYAFICNNGPGSIVRAFYGTSMLNTPTVTSLGNLGVLPGSLEDLHLEFQGGVWYGIAVGGIPGAVYRLNFGGSLANTPVATNLGNIGAMNYPQRLQVFFSGGSYYAFTPNRNNSTITRLNFGNSLGNTPTGVNLGNIGALNTCDDMSIINSGGNWYAFVINEGNSTLTRLSFGASLLNTPTGANLGNTGALNGPRGIDVYVECGIVKGLIVNRFSNDLLRLNFPAGPTGAVTSTSFGNIATFSFPHSIERFRVGDTLYAIVPNVTNNTLSRIYYPGCTNASVPSTTVQSPPQLSYNQPGTYYINLILNEGLINQSAFCKQIVAIGPTVSVLGTAATCVSGGSATVTVLPGGGTNTYSYSWSPSSQSTAIATGLIPGQYSVSVTNSIGCVAIATIIINTSNPMSATITTSSVTCNGASTASAGVILNGGNGPFTYSWTNTNQNTSTVTGIPAGVHTVTISESIGPCSISRTFAIIEPPATTLNITSTSPTACVNSSLVLQANVSGGTPGYLYNWLGGSNGYSNVVTSNINGTQTYSVNITDFNGCVLSETIAVNYFDYPLLSSSNLTICPGTQTSIVLSGASFYTWQPSVSTGSVANVSPLINTSYSVVGSNGSACTSSLIVSVDLKPSPLFSFNTYSITCARLGEADIITSGGIGPFSYTWNPTSQYTSTVGNLFPGTYSVTVLDQGSGCVFTPTVTFLPLVPLSGTVVSTPSLLCYGEATGTAGINLSGGSGSQSYTWSAPNSFQNSSTAVSLIGGTHTVTVEDALTFCSVTRTFAISQPQQINVAILASSATVCVGGAISFTANASGGTPNYTYSWVPGPVANEHTVAALQSGTSSFTIIGTDANNCAFTDSITFDFVPNPTVTILNDTICPLEIANLSALGAQTYTWNTGIINSQLLVSPPVSTEYSVIASALSCTSAATATVIIKNTPTISIGANSPVCLNDTIFLSSSGALSYSWSGPSGFVSASQNPTIVSPPIGASGNYSVKVTASNSCTNSASVNVQVNVIPIVSVGGSTVCEGQNMSLWSTGLANASYFWSGPFNFSSTNQNINISNASPNASGTYSLSVLNSQGCSNSFTAHVSIFSKPTPTILTNAPICENAQLSFTAMGGNNAIWFFPNGMYSNLLNPNIPNAPLSAAGLYSLQITSGPCVVEKTLSVVIHPLPTTTLATNISTCENSSLLLNAYGGSLYQWAGPNGFVGTQAAVTINNSSQNNSGIYSLTVTSSNNCSIVKTTTVIVIKGPPAIASGATVCLGESAFMSASGGASYGWVGPNGFSSSLPSITISSVTPAKTGIYTVIVTATNGCSTSKQVTLNAQAFELPTPSYTVPSGVCQGSQLRLLGDGGVSYFWSGPNGFTSNLKSPVLLIKDSLAAGIYTLSIKNASNCSNSATVSVKIFQLPKANIQLELLNSCVPYCATISVKGINDNPTNKVVNATFYVGESVLRGLTAKQCFEKAGVYNVSVSYSNTNQCSSSTFSTINVYDRPQADFVTRPNEVIAGNELVSFINLSIGNDIDYWNWFFINNTTDTLFTKDAEFLFDKPGIFPVALVVKNKWGCADTIVREVLVEDERIIYVPNTFTPNRDGLNDIFLPKGTGIINYTMIIYDRWGEKIFESDKFEEGWNGSFRGHECKSDVYIWKVRYTDKNDNRRELIGQVSLLR